MYAGSFARFPGLPASGWAGKPQPVLWSINRVLVFQTLAATRDHRDSHEKESLLTKKGPFEPSFTKLPRVATESVYADIVSSRTEWKDWSLHPFG